MSIELFARIHYKRWKTKTRSQGNLLENKSSLKVMLSKKEKEEKTSDNTDENNPNSSDNDEKDNNNTTPSSSSSSSSSSSHTPVLPQTNPPNQNNSFPFTFTISPNFNTKSSLFYSLQ